MTGRYVWELPASVWARDWSIDLWINGNADESPEGGGTWRSEEKHTEIPTKSSIVFQTGSFLGALCLRGLESGISGISGIWLWHKNSHDFFRISNLVLIPGLSSDTWTQHSAPTCIHTHTPCCGPAERSHRLMNLNEECVFVPPWLLIHPHEWTQTHAVCHPPFPRLHLSLHVNTCI